MDVVVVVVVVVMRWSVHCCGGRRRGCSGLGLRAVSCGLLVHVLDSGVPAEGRAWRAIERAKSGELLGGVVSGRTHVVASHENALGPRLLT
jgi:hypothetical protein